ALAALALGRLLAGDKPPPADGEPAGIAKPAPKRDKPELKEEDLPAFRVPTDSKVWFRLEDAREHARTGRWQQAVELLQATLDLPEETFVLVPRAGADGKDTSVWGGARLEASLLLRALPPAGREAYEQLSGERARDLLAEAVKGKDAA